MRFVGAVARAHRTPGVHGEQAKLGLARVGRPALPGAEDRLVAPVQAAAPAAEPGEERAVELHQDLRVRAHAEFLDRTHPVVGQARIGEVDVAQGGEGQREDHPIGDDGLLPGEPELGGAVVARDHGLQRRFERHGAVGEGIKDAARHLVVAAADRVALVASRIVDRVEVDQVHRRQRVGVEAVPARLTLGPHAVEGGVGGADVFGVPLGLGLLVERADRRGRLAREDGALPREPHDLVHRGAISWNSRPGETSAPST